jgi:hypothetical protein
MRNRITLSNDSLFSLHKLYVVEKERRATAPARRAPGALPPDTLATVLSKMVVDRQVAGFCAMKSKSRLHTVQYHIDRWDWGGAIPTDPATNPAAVNPTGDVHDVATILVGMGGSNGNDGNLPLNFDSLDNNDSNDNNDNDGYDGNDDNDRDDIDIDGAIATVNDGTDVFGSGNVGTVDTDNNKRRSLRKRSTVQKSTACTADTWDECAGDCDTCSLRFRHPSDNLDVRMGGIHGKGLFATQVIPIGQMVIEYTGRRTNTIPIDSRYAVKLTGQEMYIDAKDKRNINRYVNNSCVPNCVLQQWRDKTENERVSIVSVVEILEGVEVTVDYGDERRRMFKDGRCHCPKCSAPVNKKRRRRALKNSK